MSKLEKIAEIFNKRQETETPSGKYDDPMSVTIGTYKPGQNVSDMEMLISNTLSQIMYGEKNINKINKIAGFAKKGFNVMDLLKSEVNSTNTLITKTEELKKEINSLTEIIKKIELYNKEIGSSIKTGVLVFTQQDEELRNSLDIVIKSNNVDKILNELSNINDDKIKKFSNVLIELFKHKDDFKIISKETEPFAKSLNSIIEISNQKNNFEKFVKELINGIEKINTNKDVSEKISNLRNSLESINSIKLDKEIATNLLDLSKSIFPLFNSLNELSNISSNNLNEITNNFKENLDTLAKIDISDVSDNIMFLKGTIESINDIKIKDKAISSLLFSFNNIVDALNDLNIPKNLDITTVDNILEVINKFANLANLNIVDFDIIDELIISLPKLEEAFESIDNISNFDSLDGFKTFTSKFVDGMMNFNEIDLSTTLQNTEHIKKIVENLNSTKINNNVISDISNSTSELTKLFDNIEVFKKINKASLNNFYESLISLNKLNEVNSIDSKNIKDIVSILPIIQDIFLVLDSIKIPNKKSITGFIGFIEELSKINIDNTDSISIEFKDKLANLYTILPNVNSISNELQNLNLEGLNKTKINTFQAIMDSLNSININSDAKINQKGILKKIKVLNKILPKLEEISKTLSGNSIDIKPKSINTLNDILSAIDKLQFSGDTKINDKKLKSLESTIKQIGNIVSILNNELKGKENDFKKLSFKTEIMNQILSVMDRWNLNESKYVINLEKVQELIKGVQEVERIIKIFKKQGIDKETYDSFKYFANMLESMRQWNLPKNKKGISPEKVKELKKTIPGIIKICEELSYANFKNSFNNAKEMLKVLDVLATIDTKKFKGINLKPLSSVLSGLTRISSLVESFKTDILRNVENLELFLNELIFKDDSIISKLKTVVSGADYKKTNKDITQLTKLLHGIANTCAVVGLIGLIGPFVKMGLKTLKSFITEITDLVTEIQKLKPEGIKQAMNIMQNFGKVVLVSTLCMFIGGYFVTQYPQIIVGALAFSMLLRIFLILTIEGIAIGLQPLTKNAGKKDEKGNTGLMVDLKGFAELIVVGTFVMFLGGWLVLAQPKIILGAMGFGLALGAFLLCVTFGISIGARGGKEAQKDLKGMTMLIVAGTFIMILGAFLVMFAPKIILASFGFALALGLFLFTVVGAINLASKGLGLAEKSAGQIVKLILWGTAIMMLGGMFILFMPKLVLAGLLFGVVLGLFLKTVVGAISNNSKGLKENFKGIILALAFVTLSAVILMVGGFILMKHPWLYLHVPAFALMLFGFVYAITKVADHIGDNYKDLVRGIAGLAIVTAIVIGGCYAIKVLADATKDADFAKLGIGAVLMVGLIATFAGGAALIGKISMDPTFWLALAAIGAIELLIVGMAKCIEMIGNSMNVLANVKEISIKTILSNIGSMYALVMAMAPLAMPWVSVILLAATASTHALAVCISELSKTVQEVSELTIPIYNGTKVVGYRNLKDSDFKRAADNVAKIITTLGGAIIGVYNSNPEIFEYASLFNGDTKFSIVVRSVTTLSGLISSIAKSIKDYADLKIPEYNGTKITGYRHLKSTDFKDAAKNVSTIITTLGQTLIDLYNDYPDMFQDKSIFGSLFAKPSQTPLGMTISVTQKIGSLISSIASGVKAMGNLLIANNWDKDGNPTHYIQMKEEEIKQAGDNVAHIVKIMGETLIGLYYQYPDMFQDTSLLGNIFSSSSRTPLAMTIKVTQKIGSLISSIAYGVKAMGNLMYPTQWNKDGTPTFFKKMEKKDIENARDNVKDIITSYTKTLIGIYKANKSVYEDTSWFGGIIGQSTGNTPLGRVINVTSKIGSLISSIAYGVKSMGNLMFPTKWDKDGNPIWFQKMSEKDIKQAQTNIIDIIKTTSDALMTSYNQNKKLYESDDLWSAIKGDDGSKSPFARVINVNLKLASLISSIGSSVASISKLSIPKTFDKDGKPETFELMNNTHFTNAASNIRTIITTLGYAIAGLAKEDIFKDDSEDSPLNRILDISLKMGDLISNVSAGIKNYSELLIPNEWNKETGEVIGYRELKDNDFTNAASNIGKVITTMAKGLVDASNDDSMKAFINDSEKFTTIIETSTMMGEMISNISDGISSIALMMIPNAWNSDGTPTSFKQMDKTDFDNATDNIKTILTTIPAKLKELSSDSLFTDTENFDKLVQSCSNMGDMIISIAQGVGDMSELETTLAKKGIKIDYNKVSTNIGKVVTTIGTALVGIYNNDKAGMFKPEKLVVESGNIFNKKKEEKQGESIFQQMMTACSKMGTMILSIAEGVNEFATIDKNVKFDEAAKNIQQIITTVGGAILQAVQMPQFTSTEKVLDSIEIITKACNAVSKISNLLIKIGDGNIPVTDKNGKIIRTVTLSSDNLIKSAEKISEVLTTISLGFSMAANDNMFKEKDNNVDHLLEAVSKAISIVRVNAEYLITLSEGKINDKTIRETTFATAANYIYQILTTISTSINDANTVIKAGLNVENDIKENITKSINLINDVYKEYDKIKVNKKINDKFNIIRSSIDSTIEIIQKISKIRSNLNTLKGINLEESLQPVVDNVKVIMNKFAEIESPSLTDKLSSWFTGKGNTGGIKGFINVTKDLVEQANEIVNAPLEDSYTKLQRVITSTNETMQNFVLPENFKDQTESLDKFIKSVNSIKIDGVDYLTDLLRELNKLGINMGNMDKLVDAITKHLNNTLKDVKKAMNDLDKSIKAETKRKIEHARTMNTSINKVKNLMNQPMKVEVEMKESDTPPVGNPPSENDQKDKKGNGQSVLG